MSYLPKETTRIFFNKLSKRYPIFQAYKFGPRTSLEFFRVLGYFPAVNILLPENTLLIAKTFVGESVSIHNSGDQSLSQKEEMEEANYTADMRD